MLYSPCALSPLLFLTFSAMQEVQASLEKSIHLYWSGEGSPESALSGAKHLDPLLQTAQRHQPIPPDKGFLGTWSASGSQVQGGVSAGFWCLQLVTTPARISAQDAEGRRLQQGLGHSRGLTAVSEAQLCVEQCRVVPSVCPAGLILPRVNPARSWCCHVTKFWLNWHEQSVQFDLSPPSASASC